jgi:alcohol dehydrogenase
MPFVLGHEIVGIVVEAGREASEWLGRRIAVSQFLGCGECEMCRTGDQRLCQSMRNITGVSDAYGGYAEYVRVDASQAVLVPPALGSAKAAALVDAGTTAMNAVEKALDRGFHRPLVLGAGAVGLLAAQILLSRGISCSVVERSPQRRSAAALLGHRVYASLGDVFELPDLIIDGTGSASVVVPGLELLAPKGTWVAASYAPIPDFDMAQVSRKELVILGVRAGTPEQLRQVLELAASGSIQPPAIRLYPLAETSRAIRDLADPTAGEKPVITVGPDVMDNPATQEGSML